MSSPVRRGVLVSKSQTGARRPGDDEDQTQPSCFGEEGGRDPSSLSPTPGPFSTTPTRGRLRYLLGSFPDPRFDCGVGFGSETLSG